MCHSVIMQVVHWGMSTIADDNFRYNRCSCHFGRCSALSSESAHFQMWRPYCIDVEASFSAGTLPNGPTREKSRHRRRTSRQPALRLMGSGRAERLQNSVACWNIFIVELVGPAIVADACAPKVLWENILARA